MTRRRRLWIFTAIAAAGIGAALVGVRVLLPSWSRGWIERAASEALGRDLKISGPFDLTLSLAPTLEASDVTLADAPWGSEPSMARAAHLKASVALSSLWSPPVRIRDVEIDGVRLVLEQDPGGRRNWEFERREPPAPRREPAAAPRPPAVIEHASIRDFELIFRGPREAAPLRFAVARLEARLEPASGMIDLDAAGHFNDARWDVAGRLGTLDNLWVFRDLEHAVTGHLGDAKLALRGRIRDPLALGGPDLEVELEGPDLVAALATVGLRSPLTGPFHLRARLTPADEGVEVELAAGLAGVTAAVQGRVGALLKADPIGARIEASGPDAAVVGEWTGLDGLPPGPFEVAGRLRRDGSRFWLDDVEIRAGRTSLSVSGPLGAPPRCVGTDLTVSAKGDDLSELSALTRLRLPAGPFAARGRFLRLADALAIEDVEIQSGDTVVRGAGTIGEPPRLENLDLAVDASGPDLSWFSGIATVDLPSGPFTLRGRVARRGAALDLQGIEGRLGADEVSLEGSLVPSRRLAGSDLRARIAGPDLAAAASMAGLGGLPAEPYDVSGRVRFMPDGYRLDGVEARAGRIAASGSGSLGVRPAVDGTALDLSVQGPALSDLGAWGLPAGLPGDPFSASGRLLVEAGVYRVEQVLAQVGADRGALDGTLGPLPDLSPLDAGLEVSGPRLTEIGRFLRAEGGAAAARLPAEPYRASARVRRVPDGFQLKDARLAIADAEIDLDGTLGSGDGMRGTDVRFEARAPDGTLAAKVTGLTWPEGSIRIGGRLAREGSGTRLDGVAAAIGDVRAEISGMLGDPPKLAGTDLDVGVSGPSLAAALGPISGLSPLPAEPFGATVHVEGDADRFASNDLTLQLGESDLEGSVSARRDGRLFVEADLRSKHLDVAHLLGGFREAPASAPTAPEATKHPPRERDRLVPDEPLELDALRSMDARFRVTAAAAPFPGLPLRDVALEGELRDGALRLSRIEGTGEHGGHASATLSLEPLEEGYRLQASGALNGSRLVVSKAEGASEQAPSIDVEFTVEGAGRSLHAIAADSDGRALITMGAGRFPNDAGNLATASVFGKLRDALNPFRKSSPYTEIECGVLAAGIERGKAAVEPIAVRTDKLTVIGHGKIDFDSEAIDLVWTLKPRRGVGITAGSITNPYIKLGGTLASPSLEAKPLQAATSTGAAVATGGLTLLFRGLYDRITAERKVCVRALEEAEKQDEERAARKRP